MKTTPKFLCGFNEIIGKTVKEVIRNSQDEYILIVFTDETGIVFYSIDCNSDPCDISIDRSPSLEVLYKLDFVTNIEFRQMREEREKKEKEKYDQQWKERRKQQYEELKKEFEPNEPNTKTT